MRLTANQVNLSKGLGIVSRAISSRTTMPVLGNILLEAKGDALRLAATNREIGITCWIGAKVEDEGAITIPARLLSEFVNSLPQEQITLDLAGRTQTLNLSCAKFTANIKGIDYNEFPLLPTFDSLPPDDYKLFSVDPERLSTGIDQTIFAASTDENRPTLTGIEVTLGERMTMAATDGYRLSVRTIELGTGSDESTKVIVPARSLGELARIAADANAAPITIAIPPNRHQIMFGLTGNDKVQRVEMTSELIDARFPDYNATVPKNHNTATVINTSELLKAARVALLFARDNANIIRLALTPSNGTPGTVKLMASSAEMGDNVSVLDAEIEGEPLEIAFNAKYLIDYLAQVDSPQVALETTLATRPGVWRPVGDDSYMHITMPMHSPKG